MIWRWRGQIKYTFLETCLAHPLVVHSKTQCCSLAQRVVWEPPSTSFRRLCCAQRRGEKEWEARDLV